MPYQSAALDRLRRDLRRFAEESIQTGGRPLSTAFLYQCQRFRFNV